MVGQTENCFSEWLRVTSDPEILGYVELCHIEFPYEPSELTHF